MIIGQQKPLEEIQQMIEGMDRIIVSGCHGCVTVCRSGGQKEVEVLSSTLRLAREGASKPIEILELTLERQCDPEYLDPLRPHLDEYDGILSIACGAGIQFLAEHFPKTPVLPGLNTTFIGVTEEQGVWAERCQACGDCVLHLTGGICPVTRCSKSLFNGPCGGSSKGMCEVKGEIPCGWQLIIDRLKALGRMDLYEQNLPMKKWKSSRDGGPRKIVREDLKS